MADDPLAAELAAIRDRAQAATPGPWWSDEDELMWRLHGVHGYTPAMPDLGIKPQVINHQILKAPKQGTSYAEYWPNEADAAFIATARSDVPRLLAAVEALVAAHQVLPWYLAASDCGHPEPADDDSDEWADWDDVHRMGTGDVGRVCTLTRHAAYCPGCTAIAFGDEEPGGDSFISAPCSVRTAITRALTGEEACDVR